MSAYPSSLLKGHVTYKKKIYYIMDENNPLSK